MSRSLSGVSSGHHSSTHHTGSSRHCHAGSARLSAILKSGILTNRGKILDLMLDSGGSMPSRSLLEMKPEDHMMLDLFDLNFFYASLVGTILEDTLMELKILGDCNSQLLIVKAEADMKRHRAAKYGIVELDIADELEGIDRKQLGNEEYKLKKIAADLQYFHDTILVTYVDLTLNESFESLAQQMAVFYDRDRHLAHLTEEEAQNKITRRELARDLRLQRNHMLSANYDVDVVIDHLKAQVENSSINAESRSRYVNKWQKARTEQHEVSIQDAEATPMNNMTWNKHRLECETRIHSEVMELISTSINETIDKVEEEMTKYESHIEDIDLQIQIMKNNYQDQVEIRRELEEKYKKQEKEAQEWQTFKQARVDAGLYRKKMTHAAIVAQAWWRGMMVRHQLGPYRPPKRTPWRSGK